MTRPEPGAGKTADLLRDRGHDPLLMPLSRTVALTENSPDLSAAPAGAMVVTSAAALRHWQAAGIDPMRLVVPIYTIGEATGHAARKAGFRDVRSGDATGSELARTIADDVASGHIDLSDARPLLHVAGRVRHGGFEAAISAAKLPLQVIEIYEIEEISYSTDFILQHFSTGEPVAVLFYSGNAATLFFKLFTDAERRKRLESGRFLCMSDHVAAGVPVQLKAQIRVAAEPREQDLLSLLDDAALSS